MNDCVLRIDNVHSHLITSNKSIKKLLHDCLRFHPKGFWANPIYKKKIWDGYNDFFDDKTGHFLTGILPEVQKALKLKNINYVINDERPKFDWAINQIDDQFLNLNLPDGLEKVSLHDFQPDLANQCLKYGRGIVQAPTGAGKTFILISLLKCLPPKTPCLFMTKMSGLVHQNWEEMKKWNVPYLGRWYGKFKEPNYVMCVTAHEKTFSSIEKLLPKFKVLLVDEVHDCVSDSPIWAYKKMKSANIRIGFSATPFKWDKKKIYDVHKWTVKSHFGPLFETRTTESGKLTTADLQERNILSASEAFFYKVDKPDLTHEPYQEAVKLGIEQNFNLHEDIVRLTNSCKGRTLIVVERIEQGHYLESLIKGSVFIQGKDSLKERESTINSLKSGDRFVGIAMRHIITAGINLKIHDLINAAGGEGAHNITQLLGRGLRKANDKSKLTYHDFLFTNNPYLNKHSEWRIEVLKKEGHKVTVLDCVPVIA